jgi:hypothetical protein
MHMTDWAGGSMARMPGGSMPDERGSGHHRRTEQGRGNCQPPAPATPLGLREQGTYLPGEPAGLDLRGVGPVAGLRVRTSDHGSSARAAATSWIYYY